MTSTTTAPLTADTRYAVIFKGGQPVGLGAPLDADQWSNFAAMDAVQDEHSVIIDSDAPCVERTVDGRQGHRGDRQMFVWSLSPVPPAEPGGHGCVTGGHDIEIDPATAPESR